MADWTGVPGISTGNFIPMVFNLLKKNKTSLNFQLSDNVKISIIFKVKECSDSQEHVLKIYAQTEPLHRKHGPSSYSLCQAQRASTLLSKIAENLLGFHCHLDNEFLYETRKY
jgi:hypothetical protein